MDLMTAMGQDLTRLRNPPSTDLSVQENIEILVAATGSGRAAARALGIGESTLRGWRAGARPRRSPQLIVAAVRGATTARYNPGGYDAAYHGHTEMVINGLIQVSSDSRIRSVHVGRYIPLRRMQSVLRAWANGDDAKGERLLLKHIDENYQPLEFTNVLGVWFE